MNKIRIGSTFDSFLEDEGIKEDVYLLARKKPLTAKSRRTWRHAPQPSR